MSDEQEKTVDETWKQQAREGEESPAPEAPADPDGRPPLPEPSLKTFISGLAGQVLINMGLFANPATGKTEQDLEQAKYSIDLLDILRDKMKGNLDDEEEKLINTILYDLRMRYVEACR